jgi:hypothetical protein
LFCIYNFSDFPSRANLPIPNGIVRLKNVLTGAIKEAVNQEISLNGYEGLWLDVV